MNFCFIHNCGGRLYVTRELCGFIPSADKARRRFLGSNAKVSHLLFTNFHDSESAGCQSLPLLTLSFAWQVKSLAVCED